MAAIKLSHKGFTGSAEISLEDQCLVGRVQFIDDIITFEGETVAHVILAFKYAVDRYISYCKSTGKPANKPYGGTFNVRVGAELHKACATQACHKGINLNEFVKQALEASLNKDEITRVEHNHNHNIKIVLDHNSLQPFLSTVSEQTWGVTNVLQ